MKLQNKVAVITGAGAGIGRAIATRFAAEGATLILGDIVEDALNETAKALSDEGARVTAVVGNITQNSDVETLLGTATGEHGKLDVLVNNAGVLDGLAPLAEAEDDMFEKVMAVNAKGPFLTCRKAVQIMLEQEGSAEGPSKGVIVNLASLAGINGGRGGAAYTMSKHAVVGLTKNIAFHYGDRGIRSNCICPGGIDTDIFRKVKLNETGMKRASSYFKTTPRMGKPEEIAASAAFLASDDASYVNGAALAVDGGWIAH